MDIWTKFGVDPKFRQKTACLDVDFFQIKTKKSQVTIFGMDLEAIWYSEYLVIWTFRQIDE